MLSCRCPKQKIFSISDVIVYTNTVSLDRLTVLVKSIHKRVRLPATQPGNRTRLKPSETERLN